MCQFRDLALRTEEQSRIPLAWVSKNSKSEKSRRNEGLNFEKNDTEGLQDTRIEKTVDIVDFEEKEVKIKEQPI